jgi:hypothetical protein
MDLILIGLGSGVLSAATLAALLRLRQIKEEEEAKAKRAKVPARKKTE